MPGTPLETRCRLVETLDKGKGAVVVVDSEFDLSCSEIIIVYNLVRTNLTYVF